MTIAAAVKRFLDAHGVIYHISHHARTVTLEQAARECGICPSQVVRAVLLRDEHSVVMAILPVTYRLDCTRLRKITGRHLRVLSGKAADKLFNDCEPGSRPPLGEAYGIDCIVDYVVGSGQDVYFEPGTHNAMVHLAAHDYCDLLVNSLKGHFTTPYHASDIAITAHSNNFDVGIHELVTMDISKDFLLPELALDFNFVKEIDVIPSDTLPNSPWKTRIAAQLQADPSVSDNDFNYFVAMLNMMIQAVKCLKLPQFRGPFCAAHILAHAVSSAFLSYLLAKETFNCDAKLTYCAFAGGLFQNIGALLLGHWCRSEYQLMSRMADATRPPATFDVAQRKILNVSRCGDLSTTDTKCLGAWLLAKYHAPAAVRYCTMAVQDKPETKETQMVRDIVQLANIMLLEQGIADIKPVTLSIEHLLHQYDVKKSQIISSMNHFITWKLPIDKITRELFGDVQVVCR